MSVGKNLPRVDAYDKVTGRARYTDDLCPKDALVARIVHSTIANGLVTRIDAEKARAVPGVVEVFTCFDVPEIDFPTAGHPWSTDPKHQDIADRRLLNRRVRVYEDDVAVVVARDDVAAERAARLVEIEYEAYPPFTTVEAAMAEGAAQLHEAYPRNILAHTVTRLGDGDVDDALSAPGLVRVEGAFDTQVVQHCHIELPTSFAYMESGRIVVVSATQIPHIVRRVVGQALGIPWGQVRIVKPYLGGGFGNRQDALTEPLNAWLTLKLGGRAVKLELTREETFASTRTRHAMHIQLASAARPDGTLVARKMTGTSNQGGYASHGHAIILNSGAGFRMLYSAEGPVETDLKTVFTNIPTGGAMRGYGIPQCNFALESHMDDLARALEMDPLALRMKNCIKEGYVDPGTGITCHTSGLPECVEKGRAFIRWDERRAAYRDQTGSIRRGVGMAIFSYKTGVYPISLETASCRMVLNQDGSIQLHLGATEIGQGADTVFTQMAAQAVGIAPERVHVVTTQDTDLSPFDTGAYASRQTYVTGMAIKQTGELLRGEILDYAAGLLKRPATELSLENGAIVGPDGAALMALDALATESFYSLTHSKHLTAESTHHCTDNTIALGACFAHIEVDIPVGAIRVLDIIHVHDSGVLINPQLAEAQVHGGMSMGLGYALGEQMLFGDDARVLNGNLLDYKLPTALDMPELTVDFVETQDPTGPFGNKALGEPPAIPSAAAVRNALLHATGVAVNAIPLTPQRLVSQFTDAGLIPAR